MVEIALIVKKLVPVYPPEANVPRQFQNLRKAVFVKTFSRPFLNIPDILVAEYGLLAREKVVVFHTKRVNAKGWRNYRTPFKKVYSGPLSGLRDYLYGFLQQRVWKTRGGGTGCRMASR